MCRRIAAVDEPEKPRRRVVAIPKPPKPVNPDCVALFRGLLERAESGDVTEAAVAWIEADGSSNNERTGIVSVASMLGELKLVADDLSAAAREE